MKQLLEYKAHLTISLLLLIFTLALCLSHQTRQSAQILMNQSQERKVLSVLKLEYQSQKFKILKVQQNRDILIEIYSNNKKESFNLGAASNGSLYVQGKSTQLVSVDLDGDSYMEVVVPTLNQFFKSQLYVLKYNKKSSTFTLNSPVSYLSI